MALLTIICFSGCTSTSPLVVPTKTVEAAEQPDLAMLLRNEVDAWLGTPHEYGGTSKDGIDCSALVQSVYNDVFGVDLPRTTRLQSKIGRPVQLGDAQAGDLIFYKIDAGTRHVGIYVGDDEFMHASKSEGVTVSSLNDSYWQKRFWMVRRILDLEETAITNDEPAQLQNRPRSGW